MHAIDNGCWDPERTIAAPATETALGRLDDQNSGLFLEQTNNGIDTDCPGLGDLRGGVMCL